jgi:hypothetical protein
MPKQKDSPAKEQPTAVRLTAAYSYFDDQDQHHYWSEGQSETDPDRIQTLLDRGAPLEVVE